MLKHLSQLVKFKTGMDVRVGYPVEQLANVMNSEINNPMFSTAVGLVIKGFEVMKDCPGQLAYDVLLNNLVQEKIEPVNAPPVNENLSNSLETEPSNNGQSKKPSFLDSFRKTFSELFEENDTKM